MNDAVTFYITKEKLIDQVKFTESEADNNGAKNFTFNDPQKWKELYIIV